MRKLIFLTLITLFTQVTNAQSLNLWSESAIIIDYDSEQILYEKNKKLVIPPASMTKLITIYMTYLEIESGKVNLKDIVPISSRADYKNLPKDSSLMFIEKGQHVTLYELLLGLAIPSGNDAAIAVAEYLFGTVENYLVQVDTEMNNLGLNDLIFVDPSGFDDFNQITVEQFVEFCLILLKRFPSITTDLFSYNTFTYPQKHNGYSSIGSIKQYNHNPLIDIFPGCDGLKTGFINKSGMNISLTAKRDGRRVIGVLAGVKDKDKKKAEIKRLNDSITLLNFALEEFININLDKIKLPLIKVNNLNQTYIEPIIPYKRIFSFYKNSTYTYQLNDFTLPIKTGDLLGSVFINQFGKIYKFPIYSISEISLGY